MLTEIEKAKIIDKYHNCAKGWYSWLHAKVNKPLLDGLNQDFAMAPTVKERVYWLVHGLTDFPRCKTCGKTITKFRDLDVDGRRAYSTYCCISCSAKNQDVVEKRHATNLERYGNPVFNNSEKATATSMARYGSGRNFLKIQQTMMARYGVSSFLSTKKISDMRNNSAIQEKIQSTKAKNHTFNASKEEQRYYEHLCEIYGEDDVVRQYKDIRYPFNCDFYIKSKDLFIELNLFPTHYKEPFDSTNQTHLELLHKYSTEPANWIEKQRARIWAGTDVKKYNYAIKNKLNYLRIYSSGEYYEEGSCK